MNLSSIDSTILSTAISEGVPKEKAPLIVAQARHETGNYTSRLFRTSNNLFGMKVPRRRPAPHIAGPSPVNAPKSEGETPYAQYRSVQDSVKDLIMWHKYNRIDWSRINSPEQYAQFLKSKGFYGDTIVNYLKGLRSGLKRIAATITENPGTSLIVIFAGIAAIFFLNRKK